MDDAFALVVTAPLDRGEDVFFEDGDFLLKTSRPRDPRSPRRTRIFESLFHFGEEPGGTEGSATDHDGIDAVTVETLACAFGRTYVPVPYNRYVHTRVGFDFTDEGPIGFAAVHLRAGTAVDSEFGDAAVLKTLCEVHDEGDSIGQVEGRFIPSEACFGGDGRMDGVDDRAGD